MSTPPTFFSENQPPPTPPNRQSESQSTPVDRWTRLVQIATVATAVVAIVTLFFVYGALVSSGDLVKQNNQTVGHLGELVESNKQQITTLENLVKEIQHQSLVTAYTSGGVHDVKIDICSTFEMTDPDQNFLGKFLKIRPILVTEKGVQSIVSARMFIHLEFIGKDDLSISDVHSHHYRDIVYNPFWYKPYEELGIINVNIQDKLDEAKKDGYKFLKINFEYSFVPYSPITDFDFALQNDDQEKTLWILELKNNEKYDVLDIVAMAQCRN